MITLNRYTEKHNCILKQFKQHLNKTISANDILSTKVIMACSFNMNRLDFEQNKKVQNFDNIMFGRSMITIINKPTGVTKKTATATAQIFINSFTKAKFKTGIIKFNASDHFPIFFVADYNIHIKEARQCYIFTCDLSDISVEKFRYKFAYC